MAVPSDVPPTSEIAAPFVDRERGFSCAGQRFPALVLPFADSPAMRWKLLSVIALGSVLWTGGASAQEKRPDEIAYGKARVCGKVASEEILESSGLVASRRRPGTFWTHNDSGDAPRLFALDAQGRDRGTVQVKGAKHVDWEDLATFDDRGRSTLVIADIGDNARRRPEGTLYFVDEPAEGAKEAVVRRTVRFRYADGPRDCEAVVVTPDGTLALLVSKVLLPPARVYRLDLAHAADDVSVAEPIGAVAVSLATGMSLSPDGRRAVVVNYVEGFEFARRPGEDWPTAFSRVPRRLPLPERRQGEAVAYGDDGRSLFLTSEGPHSPLWIVPALDDK